MNRTNRNVLGAKIVLLAILGSATVFAYAAHPFVLPVLVEAAAVPFDDEPDAVAADLRLDSTLVLVLNADSPTLGWVIVPDPEFAADATGPFDRVHVDSALSRSGIFSDAQTGIVIMHDDSNVSTVRNAYLQRLQGLGFEVSNEGQSLYATNGDLAYRLVFGLDTHDGDYVVRVYLGH